MNNDLISREALKKHITEIYEKEEKFDKKWAKGLKYSLKIIDNAQTVEPFEPDYVGAERLEARQRGYEDGYHNGMEIGKTLNPKIKQGEWIIVKDERYGDNVKCPFCGKELAGTDLNFCCKCGAKLTGSEKMNGGEEERMNTEDDIKQCRTEGIPNEALILNRLQNAEILDDYATKLAQGDDVASGRMSVAEYEAVISALSYAVSYMRGAL